MWWINTEFFLESFPQLVKSIPNVQLRILLINFHLKLVTPDLLKRASENNTRLVACPSHISQHSSGGMFFTHFSTLLWWHVLHTFLICYKKEVVEFEDF
jgi:hypothetical protein